MTLHLGDLASGCPFGCPSRVCLSLHVLVSGKQCPRDVGALPGLASLSSLRLAGNPVAYARSYRCDVLSCFPPPQQHAIRLDGGVANSHERQRLRRRASGSGGRIAQVGPLPTSVAPCNVCRTASELLSQAQWLRIESNRVATSGATAVYLSVSQVGALGIIRRKHQGWCSRAL